MGQVIKLRRSSIPGTRPVDLEDGELSVNVYDGKLFFKRDDGTTSIEEVFVTDTWITGSLQFTQENADTDIMLVREIDGTRALTITSQSVLQVKEQIITPAALESGIMYSGSNFWLGIE